MIACFQAIEGIITSQNSNEKLNHILMAEMLAVFLTSLSEI